ncbi:Helix-turn-helix domain containing protein [uncultured Caudovirales phage]|uniref:Helix-turn-helix domain containing protein n=1 Tax=uncultured Caudovirales phage TaxID=2100421 RepID=A0A6J5L1M3_9CAUD|nr:Helix-turn-helix domain containing protein [uncultured Caudovirales phage]
MTQRESIIKRLRKGWTTGLDALESCGTMKLATRVGEIRQAGYNVQDRWAEVNGKRFKAYRIAK